MVIRKIRTNGIREKILDAAKMFEILFATKVYNPALPFEFIAEDMKTSLFMQWKWRFEICHIVSAAISMNDNYQYREMMFEGWSWIKCDNF